MKKILFVAAIGFLTLTACKKDYICECTYSGSYTPKGEATENDTPTINSTTLKGVSKKTAQSSYDCVSYESTYTNSDGDVIVDKTDCTLKKN